MSTSKSTEKLIAGQLLLLLMAGGLYLAMAAIFSLSYIKDSPIEKQQVFQRFDTLFSAAAQGINLAASMSTEKSFDAASIAQNINDVRELKNRPEVINLKPLLRRRIATATDSAVILLNQQLTQITLQADKVHEQYLEHQTQLNNICEAARIKFLGQAPRLSPGLLAKYGEDLLMFIANYKTDATIALNQFFLDFRRRYSTLEIMTTSAKRNAERISQTIEQSDSAFTIYRETLVDTVLLPPIGTFLNKQEVSFISPDSWPQSGVTGEEWGRTFVFLVKPIAQSKNVDVLLVCGMLGFGLLGATIAIFITNTNSEHILKLQNLTQIIVRGFSAAIVVYLALRGGIALLTNNNGDPNPLALFLFCFIGAVFSERIWAWAKVKISDSFSSQTKV